VGVSHFSITTEPVSTTAGSAIDVTVSALDAFNQVVNDYTGTIHFTTSDMNHVLPDDYTFLANEQGVHTFTGGVILRTAGSQTVSVNDTATPSAAGSANVSIDPAAADHLFLLQQPTDSTAGEAILPALEVEILDRFNNLTSSLASITMSLGANPGGGTLAGTTTQAAISGIATFVDLSIDKAGEGYTLQAMNSGLTGTISNEFTITPAAADHLFFLQQPTDTVAGQAIAPTVQVEILDRFGNRTASTADVSIAIGANPGSGTLAGTTTQAAISGTATFGDLWIDTTGVGYTLQATSSGLTGSTSNEFTITPAAADHLFLLQQPTDSMAGEAIMPALEVEILDRFNNLTSSLSSVTMSFGANPGGGTLAGTTTEAAIGGIATFNDLWIDKTGVGYTLQATSSGLTGTTSNEFNITPAAADHLFFLQEPSDAVAGQAITPAIEVEILDRFGNLTASSASVSMTIGANPVGGSLSGATTEAANAGIATFEDLSIDQAGNGYTLVANGDGLTGATSSSFNIRSSGANQPPVLDPIPDLGLSIGRSLTYTAHATDPDSPPQTLAFSLDPGAPAGAQINSSSGVLTVSNLKFGTYTLTLRVTDNGSPPSSAAQTFHVFVAPQVKGITRNDGSVKNPTTVTFLTVTFNTRVNIDAGAFELVRLGSGGGAVEVAIASINVINGKTVVTLQFSGSFVLPNGALVSGQYTVTTHGSLIHGVVTGLALDGDNNGLPGGDNIYSFFVP
jgi:hypothetical protein